MSDTSQGEGWWEASDGKWYLPEEHGDFVDERPPPPGLGVDGTMESDAGGVLAPTQDASLRPNGLLATIGMLTILVVIVGYFLAEANNEIKSLERSLASERTDTFLAEDSLRVSDSRLDLAISAEREKDADYSDLYNALNECRSATYDAGTAWAESAVEDTLAASTRLGPAIDKMGDACDDVEIAQRDFENKYPGSFDDD